MSVGFVLPPGAPSRANNLKAPGTLIDLSGPDPFSFPDGSAESEDSISRRYGMAKQLPGETFQIPDTPGLHVTDYQSALEEIWKQNPGWFAEHGLGDATGGDGHATQLESHDAKYAAGIADQVIAEGKRLFMADSGTVEPPPAPVHPPVDPPPPPPPPVGSGGAVSGDPGGGSASPPPAGGGSVSGDPGGGSQPPPAPVQPPVVGEDIPPLVLKALADLASLVVARGPSTIYPAQIAKLNRVLRFMSGATKVIRS